MTPTMVEMVEAHLQNVLNEINTLKERKKNIERDIDKLTEYLHQGNITLNQNKNSY